MSDYWIGKPNCLDYYSKDGKYLAIYKRTYLNGFACYWTFDINIQQHLLRNAMVIGGLPSFETLERIKKYEKR